MEERIDIEEVLKSLNGNQLPGASSAAFQLACLSTIGSMLPRKLDEESMTGALAGAIIANIPWCNAHFSSDGKIRGFWSRYRKSGIGHDAEPVTGADFAIVLRMPKNMSRIAIFQAKRRVLDRTFGVGCLDLHHMSPPRGNHPYRRAQFLNLWEWGKKLESEAGAAIGGTESLSWVHYLSYSEKAMRTLTLSQMQDCMEVFTTFQATYDDAAVAGESEESLAKRKPVGKGRVYLGAYVLSHLSELLARGCSETASAPSGWLQIPDSSAKALLPTLVEMRDVFEMTVNAPKRTAKLKAARIERDDAAPRSMLLVDEDLWEDLPEALRLGTEPPASRGVSEPGRRG